jgi:hypothetical protein
MDWEIVPNYGITDTRNMKYRFVENSFELSFMGVEPFTLPIELHLGGKAADNVQDFLHNYPDEFQDYLFLPSYCLGAAVEMLAVMIARYREHRERIPIYGGLVADCFVKNMKLRSKIEKGGKSPIILLSSPSRDLEVAPDVYGAPFLAEDRKESLVMIMMKCEDPIQYQAQMAIGDNAAKILFELQDSNEAEFDKFFTLASHFMGGTAEAIFQLISHREWNRLQLRKFHGMPHELAGNMRILLETIMPLERQLFSMEDSQSNSPSASRIILIR